MKSRSVEISWNFYNDRYCNYSVSRFFTYSFPVQVSRYNLEDRTHSLAEHFDLFVQIDYVESDGGTRTVASHSEVKPCPVVVLELRAVTVVLCPQVELVIPRIFGVWAIHRFAYSTSVWKWWNDTVIVAQEVHTGDKKNKSSRIRRNALVRTQAHATTRYQQNVEKMISSPRLGTSGIFTCSTLARLAESKLLKNTKLPQAMFSTAFAMTRKDYVRCKIGGPNGSFMWFNVRKCWR